MDAKLDEAVRRRAGNRCEYCRMPQEFESARFQIDHAIAQKHSGNTALDNLALCCIRCNLYKGPNIAGLDPITGALTPLFHPRQNIWAEHFTWNGPLIV